MHVQSLDQKQARLTAWLKAKIPDALSHSVSPLWRAGSGFSGETYLFDLRYAKDGRETIENLVVRWAPESVCFLPEDDLGKQFLVMKCLAEGSDLPLPRPYWFEEDPIVLGTPFYIMGRVEGEVQRDYPRGPDSNGLFINACPDDRADMWKQAVAVMARLHSLDYDRLGLAHLDAAEGANAIDRRIAYLERLAAYAATEAKETIPVLDAAFQWLKVNKYQPSDLCLCWGDARPGNIIYRDRKVAAVLDWELAHIGRPESDLAYFLLIEGAAAGSNGLSRLEGIPGREETIEHYENLTGKKVENLFFHEVLEALNLGLMLVLTVSVAPKKGVKPFPPDFIRDNGATRALAKLLGVHT